MSRKNEPAQHQHNFRRRKQRTVKEECGAVFQELEKMSVSWKEIKVADWRPVFEE